MLEETSRPKEIRTNDGRIFRVESRERWALGNDVLLVLEEDGGMNHLAVRNIASIQIVPALLPGVQG